MKKQLITAEAPKAIGAYSQGIDAQGFVFVSGQIPIDPKTGEMKTDIAEATVLVLKNIEQILKSSGLTLNDVVKTTVFLTNIDDFPAMNKVYESVFNAPYPARTTVGVCALPRKALLEVECIAARLK